MPKAGVLLDRDGTVIELVEYLADPERLRLLPGAATGIRLFNRAGIPVAVVTNQSGIARGLFDEERLAEIHARLRAELGAAGAHLDGIYHCPHHPRAGIGELRCECDCRKPEPGLLLRAAAELDLDLRASFMVGDARSDVDAARAAGCTAVLVRTGSGAATEQDLLDEGLRAGYVADDLEQAARWIFLQLGARAWPTVGRT